MSQVGLFEIKIFMNNNHTMWKLHTQTKQNIQVKCNATIDDRNQVSVRKVVHRQINNYKCNKNTN